MQKVVAPLVLNTGGFLIIIKDGYAFFNTTDDHCIGKCTIEHLKYVCTSILNTDMMQQVKLPDFITNNPLAFEIDN